MRLIELTGIKQTIQGLDTQDVTHDDWETVLSKHGFSALGTGHNARVYGHSALNYVLKIYDTHDAGYRYWVAQSLQNKDNPYFPRFRGRDVRIDAQVRATRMETLVPAGPDVEHFLHAVRQLRRQYRGDWLEPAATYFAYDPQLVQALEVMDAGRQAGFMIDLKRDNIMMRGQQMVITDPLY